MIAHPDFANCTILVIGDVILDRYFWGDVARISPEAPVPVVRIKKKTLALGGAGNVAMNLKGLNCKQILLGVGVMILTECFYRKFWKKRVSETI